MMEAAVQKTLNLRKKLPLSLFIIVLPKNQSRLLWAFCLAEFFESFWFWLKLSPEKVREKMAEEILLLRGEASLETKA